MPTRTAHRDDSFYGALAVAVVVTSFSLVIAAGALPEGRLDRGDLIVYGHGALLAVVTAALIARGVYALILDRLSRTATSVADWSRTPCASDAGSP